MEEESEVTLKLAKIEEYRQEGNEFFRNGNLSKAIYNYHCATMYIKDLATSADSSTNQFVNMIQKGNALVLSEEEKEQLNNISLPIFNNMSAVYVKQKKHKKAIEYATKALNIDENNSKALFRRGKSYLAINETEKAERDLNQANILSGEEDKAILKELERLRLKIAQNDKKDKQFYSKMF